MENKIHFQPHGTARILPQMQLRAPVATSFPSTWLWPLPIPPDHGRSNDWSIISQSGPFGFGTNETRWLPCLKQPLRMKHFKTMEKVVVSFWFILWYSNFSGEFWYFGLIQIKSPQKSNIDRYKKKTCFKGVHLIQTIILGIHVSFRGCRTSCCWFNLWSQPSTSKLKK